MDGCGRITHERLVINSTSRHVGAVVSISCEEGFKLDGPSVLTCGENRIWSDYWPSCKEGGEGKAQDQAIIIGVCAAASVVALAILVFSFYMLISNCRKDKTDKKQQKRMEENIKDIRIFQAVSQDCVGMPALVYDNMHSSLRGKPQVSAESSRATSQTDMTDSQMDLATEKAIIF